MKNPARHTSLSVLDILQRSLYTGPGFRFQTKYMQRVDDIFLNCLGVIPICMKKNLGKVMQIYTLRKMLHHIPSSAYPATTHMLFEYGLHVKLRVARKMEQGLGLSSNKKIKSYGFNRKLFDNIDHELLMREVERHVKETWVCMNIKDGLKLHL